MQLTMHETLVRAWNVTTSTLCTAGASNSAACHTRATSEGQQRSSAVTRDHRPPQVRPAERVQPDMDTLPPLVLTADEAGALRATGGLLFSSVAVMHDQNGTILLIARWAGPPLGDRAGYRAATA